ncbi:ATP-binding cassette subfamily B protein [Leucobacter exalbidus]|uniref:ATP-binding cassette subfamily B protein n=1 Tax=Leucobacter exalbidus TaxID=662960 RepID=A0A940Q0A5_9MICO|nr:ABC transporter ATP-binding protein [Leucobacter exalbidus]MBP1327371.1 ATP-binding cassette subfamily B protein [Leucobacter exalbidus]
MSTLLRILRFTRSLTPYYVGIMVAAAIITAAGIAVPFITGAATDVVVDAVASVNDGSGVPEGAIRTVVLLALALLAASLVETFVSNVGGYWGDVMSARMRTILSTRYFEQLLALPQRYFDSELSGTIVARLNRSITEVTNFMKSFSNMFVTMIMTTIAVLTISAWHYWPLAVLLAIAYPLYLWLTALTSRKWQRIEDAKNVHVDEASGRFAEVIGQMRVVKSFAREESELNKFDGHFNETIGLTSAQSRHWHTMDGLRRAVLNVIFFALYIIIFVRTVTGFFTPGEMVMLIQLMAMARQPVQNLSWVVDMGQRAAAGSRSYFEVMDLDPATASGSGSFPIDPDHAPAQAPTAGPRPAVSFKGVSFGYDDDSKVLEDITFHAHRGERIAFVGESGGGKSTLISLLLGFYGTHNGNIEVAGAGADLASLRRGIGVVFQDPSLFSGTIAENIAYGRPDATRAQIEDVAGRAAVAEFVAKLPDGYDTLIGERGMKLSGGQKQRIAVARAMLKDAPILVLDEATSALDTKSERLVQQGLDDLMHDRTSFIIAHRLSTIAEVDRIITLKGGRIDEVGSPAELATSGGIYAELLSLQNSASKADRKRLKRFDVIG